ncbi:hypothetical protein ACPWR0_06110 [Pandoraea pneumonica]|uniref:hypothetical protein n=1 Tax=Pandoraea pneumonica TaxID=2508299 RepID=UPI003CE93383
MASMEAIRVVGSSAVSFDNGCGTAIVMDPAADAEGPRKGGELTASTDVDELVRQANHRVEQFSENLRGMLAELMRLMTDMFDKLAATQRSSAAQTRSERWTHDMARFDAMRVEADLRYEGNKRQAGFQIAGGLFQTLIGGAGLSSYAIPKIDTYAFQAISQLAQAVGGGTDKGLNAGGTLEHARYERDATYKNVEMQFRKEAAEGIGGDGHKAGEAGGQSIERGVDIVRQFVELAKQLNQTIMSQR